MMRVGSSQAGSSSRGYFTSERSASVQEMGCVEVPQTGCTIRRSKLWRRLSLIVKLSRWFRNVAEIKKLEKLQQVDAWVGASWLALSRHTSASVPNIGQLHNSHEVGMAVRLEDWRELAVEPNQSRRVHRLVNLDQRQEAKVAMLTIKAALRLVNGLQPPTDCGWYEDPLTFETMCDPVKCNDGRTYDRWTVISNRTALNISPYTRRPFAIAVDDVNVRSWLFWVFPEQESQFRFKRADYRAKALRRSRSSPAEVDDAIEMLNNVLQWAPEDAECLDELDAICRQISFQSSLSSSVPQESAVHDVSEVPATVEENQPDPLPILTHRSPQRRDSQAPRVVARVERSRTYVIPTIMHEDLVRERYAEQGRYVLLFLFIYMGLWVFLSENQRTW